MILCSRIPLMQLNCHRLLYKSKQAVYTACFLKHTRKRLLVHRKRNSMMLNRHTEHSTSFWKATVKIKLLGKSLNFSIRIDRWRQPKDGQTDGWTKDRGTNMKLPTLCISWLAFHHILRCFSGFEEVEEPQKYRIFVIYINPSQSVN